MEQLSVTVKNGIESERDRVPEEKDKNIVILNKSIDTMVVNDQKASKRIYTIQTGSFINIERAQKQFDLIVKGLIEKELEYLRIEKIGEFYCVRLGKFISNAEAKIKLESVKSRMPGCTIVKTRYLEERIEKIYTPRKSSRGGQTQRAIA
jgi:cell division protein FtsN